jgi:hypothetical protein
MNLRARRLVTTPADPVVREKKVKVSTVAIVKVHGPGIVLGHNTYIFPCQLVESVEFCAEEDN